MGRGAAAITVLAAALALPAAATATTSIDDHDGDTLSHPSNPQNYDITTTTAGRSGKNIVQTVTVVGTPPVSSPLILIDVPPHTSRWCDYVVGRTDYGTGVFECEYMDKVGSAKVTRSGDTVRFTYKSKAIGSPKSWGWMAITRAPIDGTTVTVDYAPDGPDEFEQYR